MRCVSLLLCCPHGHIGPCKLCITIAHDASLQVEALLLYQGDIESYAAMSPKDLTDRFEHISGSETYRKQYHELESQKLKAEEQTSFLFSKRKGVTQEKKQKKEQKEEAEKHVKMQEELVGCVSDLLPNSKAICSEP